MAVNPAFFRLIAGSVYLVPEDSKLLDIKYLREISLLFNESAVTWMGFD